MNERIDVLAALDALSQANVGPLERKSIAGVRAAVAELIRLVGEIDDECSNNKPDFGRVVKLAAEAAAVARVGAP